ncbi:uncharacterized protein KY384_000263 [Bacidia gigantensis]|uniref:uncharacterized protein n=1 Tax=Bacidia gigantensis TaxID=2732470 RepID=UPI001D0451F7|nr:uncharacterized protein KY384_000263 [Bacidia gigantensis]KAG8526270.1 hypothetical protein KY384_000263 [Bacidia gigantensis]
MLGKVWNVSLSSLLKTAFVLLGIWLSVRLLGRIRRTFQVRRLAAAQGCGPAVRWKSYDPLFGLDLLWTIYTDYTAHKFLDATVNRFIKLQTNTIEYSTLWGSPTISTIEPENLKCILATKFKDFNIDHYRKEALKTIIGEGIFASDGQFWQHSRELLKPIFARAKIDDPTFLETHADDLVKAIYAEGDNIMDLQQLFSSASLDIITEFLFGESARSLDPDKRKSSDGDKTEAEKFYDAFSCIVRSINGQDSKFGVLSFFLPDFSFKKNKKIMDAYVERVIENAIADEESSHNPSSDTKNEGPQRDTFLSEIVKATQDRPRLCAEFLNILLAGRDTTESFLSSIFFTLSQRPDIFSKLQHEIDSSGIPMAPSFSQLKSLPYLRAILNEAQRLYPSAPENDRQAITDTVLPLGGGPNQKLPVFVKKGTTMHWSTFALHRRKDLYGDDAAEFRPERWLDGPDGEKGLRVSWEYIPFNGGPRVCIGQQFALMEVSYLTVRLVREFGTIAAVEKKPWVEKATIVATVNGGVKVKVTPRK